MVSKTGLFLSFIIISFLLFLIAVTFVYISKVFRPSKTGKAIPERYIYAFLLCSFTLVCILNMSDYAYPFERKLEPELYAVIDVPAEHTPMGSNGCWDWYAVYDEYGFYPGSRYLTAENYYYHLGHIVEDWPEYDLVHYTYIITFCQQIDSLTYNVWETVDSPFRTGAKAGHMVLDDKIDSTRIYIYRIPKMRIDNNEI